MEEKQSYYIVIPTYLWEDPKLSWGLKRLYGRIVSLCGKEGFCWASNHYFSKELRMSVSTIKRYLKKLKDAKELDFEVIRNEKKEVIKRKIWISRRPPRDKAVATPSVQNDPTSVQVIGEVDPTSVQVIGENEPESREYSKENICETAVSPWDFLSYRDGMQEDKRRLIRIIGLYWKYKGFSFENLKQAQSALQRDLRPAKNLEGYDDKRINDIFWYCDRKYTLEGINWTLGTAHKVIDMSEAMKKKSLGV